MNKESTKQESEKPAESQIDKLVKMVEDQQKQIEILTKSANKDRLARHTPKETIGRAIRVGVIEGKLITSWKTISDKVRYDPTGSEVDQRGVYTLEDGEEIEYVIGQGHEKYESVWVDVDLNKCKFNFDKKGNRREILEYSFIWKGKETKLPFTFVNPS
jgi:hypothetical protein